MHKSFKNLGLASAAMALVMAPTLASAQEQGMPSSMPETGTATTPPPATSADTMTQTYPDAVEGTTQRTTTDGTSTDRMNTDGTSPDRTAPTKSISPAEQDAAIASWPAETQTYYRSLDDERKKMFWALSDTDKVRLSQLPEDQRETAWNQIKAQFKNSKG